MPLIVVQRGRNFTVERDDAWAPGQRRATITVHDQHYLDDTQIWQPVDETVVDDNSVAGYVASVTKMRHQVRLGSAGERRWYPRRDHPNEYITAGKPDYWRVSTSQWRPWNLTGLTKVANVVTWETVDYRVDLIIIWNKIKLHYLRKTSNAPPRFRFPLTFTGLTLQADWTITSNADGTVVGRLVKPICWDANGSETTAVAVPATYAGGNLEIDATGLGVIYPITIDPTLTLQPDGTAGLDTELGQGDPTTNYATTIHAYLGQGVSNNSRRVLIKFNLTDLPSDAVISSATFSIYVTQIIEAGDPTCYVYRQKRAWVEAEATWNIYSTGNNWATAGGFGADDCEQTAIGSVAIPHTDVAPLWKDISLTPTTKAGLDLGNGWLLKMNLENADLRDIATSDNATPANRPKLVVVYTTGIQVQAQADGSGLLAGTLTTGTHPTVALQTQADGDSAVSPALSVTRQFQAQADGLAASTGQLQRTVSAQAQTDGSASASGALSVQRQLQAQADGSGTVSGAISVTGQAQGQADGSAIATGALSVSRQLQAQSDGQAAVQAALQILQTARAQSDGQGSVAGVLGVTRALGGQADGQGSPSVNLTVLRQFQGEAAGLSTGAGDLTVVRALSALSAGVGNTEAALAVGVVAGRPAGPLRVMVLGREYRFVPRQPVRGVDIQTANRRIIVL